MIASSAATARTIYHRIDSWITRKTNNHLSLRQVFFLAALIVMFGVGYYLRSYNSLHHYLPYSPYEAFEENYHLYNASKGEVVHFTDKIILYPTKLLIGSLVNKYLGDFYLVYCLGFLAIFLLGWELTGSKTGGLFSVSIFTIAPENFLYYTRSVLINDSGLCYVASFFSIYFLTRYLKTSRWIFISSFIVSGLIALTSYHTGASALTMIFVGLFVSLVYSKKNNWPMAIALCSLILFYFTWLYFIDTTQLALFKSAYNKISLPFILLGLLLTILLLLITFIGKRLKAKQLAWFGVVVLGVSVVLILTKFNVLNFLIVRLGVPHYYISAVTLNNYLAQILLTHWYIIVFIPLLWRRSLTEDQVVLRGWIIGVTLIAVGLAAERYFGRLPDYSFPLTYVLFAQYWVKTSQGRRLIVTATIVVIVISQFFIFNDPFTQRRYYTADEVKAAENIVNLHITNLMVSDLRTAALFRYVGKGDVIFYNADDEIYDYIFYNYHNIPNIGQDKYVVLTKAMKAIVYSNSFEMTPLDDKVFEYYNQRFTKVYDDGTMMLYDLKNSNHNDYK